jgi:hypothetical protein
MDKKPESGITIPDTQYWLRYISLYAEGAVLQARNFWGYPAPE